MHHLARHCVACFLTRGDLVIVLIVMWALSSNLLSLFIDIAPIPDSLCIGKKGVMSLRDFLLILIGQSIMGTGCGSHAPHFFTRYI